MALTVSNSIANLSMNVALVDMGDTVSPDLHGILIAEQDLQETKVGITEQFLENAGVYHQRYTSVAYFRRLIDDAVTNRIIGNPELILDVGSGSGNSVLPCLDLYPEAKIIATDLSQNLLAILRDHVAENPGQRDRLALVCVDATKPYFEKGSADLVIGAAILHHLLDPSSCIRSACHVLKPGGLAIFFEPFESGNAILRLAYSQIIRLNRAAVFDEKIETRAETCLSSLINDYTVRAGTDKSADIFRHIDDKWLFTRSYFENVIAPLPDIALEVVPLNSTSTSFVDQTMTNLRLALGLGQEQARSMLPKWAWDILVEHDASVSAELRRDLPIEACVILKRSAMPQ